MNLFQNHRLKWALYQWVLPYKGVHYASYHKPRSPGDKRHPPSLRAVHAERSCDVLIVAGDANPRKPK